MVAGLQIGPPPSSSPQSAQAGTTRRAALAGLSGALLLPDGVAAAPLQDHSPAVSQVRWLFGSPAELIVRPRAGADLAPVFAEVFKGLQRMNDRWNAWKPGELTRLNRAFREGRSTSTSPALLALIRSAAQLEAQSLGLFNPAIGGAVRRWGFHDDVMRPGERPREASLAPWRRAAPCLAQIEIRGTEVFCANAQVQLDFGAYAKGVAINWALQRLRARGIVDAVVNLGGNLAAVAQPDAAPWRIGIRDPFGDGLAASLHTRGQEAVVTSGSYERYRMLDGERCTHILDPHTASPARGLVSVTVLHADAGLADAAATALLVAGRQGWRRVAERMGVRDVMLIAHDGRGEVSATLAPRLQFASAAWRAGVAVV